MDSAERAERRRRIAVDIAVETIESDNIEVDDEPSVLYVDEGYWITARVFVSADDVEERM